jgi:lipoprotein NlpD
VDGARTSWTGAALALALVIGAAACSSRSGGGLGSPGYAKQSVNHIVQPGENIYRIAKHYGVSANRLMQVNGISDPRELRVGQTIVIPAARSSAIASSLVPLPGGPVADRQFDWPVSGGLVSSGFGIRDGVKHDGIDIASPAGTQVHAAGSGSVIYSGNLRGYGNVVIIKHDEHYVTVYAHNRENLVTEGTAVSEGQVIAEIGSSGHTTGSNLHFEVRRDNVAYNPLEYLPARAAVSPSYASSGGS